MKYLAGKYRTKNSYFCYFPVTRISSNSEMSMIGHFDPFIYLI